ncbi:uncharacterized protein LOC127417862 [Myxocyprinus asiaticus]|uniref:uncharacterized protein LOC127417862 n=1 Tax=Myxocyprinus asiaticus TaxID=70543 RepID=UPI0022225BDE|nr:uncharacterized protein LOC127417862 [Myxocyprinus asiaticus]
MLFIFGLLLLLIPTCVEMFCRFNQTDPCYAALGHKLYLQMVTDARDQDLELYKWIDNGKEKVFRVKNNKEKKNETHKSIINRSEFIFNNGTLIINSVIRTDSGTYTLELYNSTGTQTHAVNLTVIVEAPIGSVEVSIKCWSSVEKRASCSSEGDQLIFSWTLNGQKLKDGNNTIHLDEETSGNITCTVNNHVSHGQNTISVNRCPGVEMFCRFNQTDPCYAALGHKLYLQMVTDARDQDLELYKWIDNEKEKVFRVKNKKEKKNETHKSIINRSEFVFNNGTLIINSVIRTDSGTYTLELYHSTGSQTHAVNLPVIVEAPIGSVEVSIKCWSSGEKRASCSSEGDQLIFIWTLNGQKLENRNNTIHLDEETSGNITCTVNNHVSQGQNTISVNRCPGVEMFCRFNQTDPCYAALGHKLYLQMVTDDHYHELKLYKWIDNEKEIIFKVKNKKEKKNETHESIRNRSEFIFNNGTLIINSVIRTDSGTYTLELYNSTGSQTHAVNLPVIVEAPIGSVEVSIKCWSSGEKRASCSSEGDQLIFIWTLNGQKLEDGNNGIRLDEETSGNITCTVNNHVSHGQNTTSVNRCPGVEMFCRFNQTDPCYAALGHKLYLQMVTDARDQDLELYKWIDNGKEKVFRVKNKKEKKNETHKSIRNRSEFIFNNGTLIINNMIRTDSGTYTLELYNSDGSQTHAVNLSVIVEAPIGSVEVSINCWSSGEKRASCSSEGDQLIFSWTLNGQELEDGNNTINLDEETSGNLTCTVNNYVSKIKKNTSVNCPYVERSVSVVFVVVWSLEMMFLLTLLGGFHIYITYCSTHTSGKKQEIKEHQGVEMFCRFNQTDPCYAALGHKLYLQMVTDDHYHELKLYKWIDNEKEIIFKVKNKKEKKNETHESIRNRSEFIFNNGTLIINSVIRTDSGTYTLELYHSDGTQTHAVNLPVIVEAPIGSVEVSIKCWSSGEKRASCSSEGDQLIFSWTLNGQKLENRNNTIHLDEETSGNITCTVNNHVSHGQKNTSVNRCPGTTTATVTSHLNPTVANSTQTSSAFVFHRKKKVIRVSKQQEVLATSLITLCSVVVILIVLVIIACYVYKMKQPKLRAAVGETELVYADISHKKHNREDEHKRPELTLNADVEYTAVGPQTNRKKRKMKEEDVQYGEVSFTPAVSNNHQYKEQEDCVYSQVQRQ